MSAALALPLRRPQLLRHQVYIGGAWRDAAGGASYAVMNPATGLPYASAPDASAADARAAVDAAAAAFPAWRETPARERAQLLKRWHALIVAHTDDLAALIANEMGKPLAEARGEVAYGASYVEWFAEEAVRSHGDVIPPAQVGRQMLAVREPVGVVAAITPWNFPLAMIARKIAPALAAGCTVVGKPAEDTPFTALALVALAAEAGFPPGVLNLVTCARAGADALVGAWLADSRVRKITFTGSTPVGKHLARQSADTLKRLSLELGGNAPLLVFEDADLDVAVDGLMKAKFRNGGQTCVCPNRIYVHRAVYAAFAARLAARVAALTVGPAAGPSPADIGPMINARAIEKIERHVADAVQQGARVLVGGQRVRNAQADGPHYYAPTVLEGVTREMLVFREETFGPVVPLFEFSDEAEAIAAANDTPFGLAAYVFTRDLKRLARVASRLETGILGLNEGAFASEAAPFGGVKESGYGREGSQHGLDDYQQFKYLCQGALA
jgi:succinate-semialdehyde dehydrogenase / glutarate-semialdehyde dehydrogenase